MRWSRRIAAFSALLAPILVAAAPTTGAAERAPETLHFTRDHRGRQIQIPAVLLMPPGSAKVPAMVIQHGSGGATDAREFRYARELVAMGVAALVIDSFKPRGIASTVTDQSTVTAREMTDDAFAALKALAGHARIDKNRIGIIGFSKGGTVALLSAHERRAARLLPAGLRFALHVPVYPACNDHFLNRQTSRAPILMLIGGADSYAGVAPCTEYARKLKADGAKVELKVYPGAQHGFDGDRDYQNAKGENWSKCVFDEQADGSWQERKSGITIADTQGQRIEAGFKQAIAACRTLGISGGPNAAAKAAAMSDLQAAVRHHLMDGR